MILTQNNVEYCHRNKSDEVEPGFIRRAYYRRHIPTKSQSKNYVDIVADKITVDKKFVILLSLWNTSDWVYTPVINNDGL
jgi:hypothetical protein